VGQWKLETSFLSVTLLDYFWWYKELKMLFWFFERRIFSLPVDSCECCQQSTNNDCCFITLNVHFSVQHDCHEAVCLVGLSAAVGSVVLLMVSGMMLWFSCKDLVGVWAGHFLWRRLLAVWSVPSRVWHTWWVLWDVKAVSVAFRLLLKPHRVESFDLRPTFPV